MIAGDGGRPLDADDVGPEVGQHHAGKGNGSHAGDLQDVDTCERTDRRLSHSRGVNARFSARMSSAIRVVVALDRASARKRARSRPSSFA